MWEYIAGLFDGDGCPSIGMKSRLSEKKRSILIAASISAGDRERFKPIKNFLLQNNVICCVSKGAKGKHKTKDGWRQHTSYQLQIIEQKSLKIFLQSIYPFVLFKKKQIEILLEALRLKEELKSKGLKIRDNFYLFDELRHELHKYSRKGPRKLLKW